MVQGGEHSGGHSENAAGEAPKARAWTVGLGSSPRTFRKIGALSSHLSAFPDRRDQFLYALGKTLGTRHNFSGGANNHLAPLGRAAPAIHSRIIHTHTYSIYFDLELNVDRTLISCEMTYNCKQVIIYTHSWFDLWALEK